MATAAKPSLKFNDKPIADAEARELLKAIYGEKRVEDILKGLADGTYRCASVAGGHIVVDKATAS